MKTKIATHRGLDPQRTPFPWRESSFEAFQDHLSRGFWIEFDLQLSSSGDFYVSHHQIPHNEGEPSDEVLPLNSLLSLMRTLQGKGAMHIKHFIQKDEILRLLVERLNENRDLIDSLLLFDVTPTSGRLLKSYFSEVHLAPSVSHEYDIHRFNSCVGGTLMTFHEAVKNRGLFNWIWFDEWDLIDRDGSKKTLYNSTTFTQAREYGFKIAVVSPELHATSPGLLGNESHPDGCSDQRNTARIQEILKLEVDLICTDYPDKATRLLETIQSP